MKRLPALAAILTLAACAQAVPTAAPVPDALRPGPDDLRPQARPGTLDISDRRPPPRARTAEQFDTTTPEERAAAAAPAPPPAAGPLGTTIASLGDPVEQGFWLKTPLVSTVRQGRVIYVANGKSVQVELRPSGGDPGSGSQISLAALRLLEAPLTELVELEVFPE